MAAERRDEAKVEEPSLPPGWSTRLSRSTGKTVYVHRKFGIEQWLPPPFVVTQVAAHYDTLGHQELVASKSVQSRGETARGMKRRRARRDCAGVAAFNNWVTSCQCSRVAQAVAAAGGGAKKHIHVVDLAGGKGSGMQKWHHDGLTLGRYTLIDVSVASLGAAKARLTRLPHPPVTPAFVCMDVTRQSRAWRPPKESADVAVLQFAANYLAKQPEGLATALRLAAYSVRPGGYLIVTWTNGEKVAARARPELLRRSHSTESTSLHVRCGTADVFCSKKAAEAMQSGCGTPMYTFHLAGAVEGCTEHYLAYHQLEALAAAGGWKPCEFLSDITAAPPAWDSITVQKRPALAAADVQTCSLYATALFIRAAGGEGKLN